MGGVPVEGVGFAAAVNPEAIDTICDTLDMYDGGLLDMTFLGAAEIDRNGNVNVSKFGTRCTGPGGFINISQSTPKVCFMCAFTAGKSDIAVEEILIQETAMTMANSAVALVHVTDSADVETVKSILAARAQTQADGGAWYPASCETWANAVIVAEGNYVGMFVYPEGAQDMADAFTAAYGG